MPSAPTYQLLPRVYPDREALGAVVDDSAGSFDQILCCGDLIGYGADPNLAVEWVRDNCAAVVVRVEALRNVPSIGASIRTCTLAG